MKTRRIATMILILGIMVSSCNGSGSNEQADLEGITWILTSFNDNHPVPDTQLTLWLEGDQVSGNAGCNHYGGTYRIKGNEITFSDLYNTEMACVGPEGVMEQEQAYLDILRDAQRYTLEESVLTIIDSQQQRLIFEKQPNSLLTPAVSLDQPSPIPPTSVVLTSEPTQMAAYEIPASFKEYQDSEAGISIFIPESWLVTGIVEGQQAVLQSYAVEKYVGGEMLEEGDTKCDLYFHPQGTRAAKLLQQWKSNDFLTLISEEELVLRSGKSGTKLEIESMGRSTVLITEIDTRSVVLTCFGDQAQFNEIAVLIGAGEPSKD